MKAENMSKTRMASLMGSRAQHHRLLDPENDKVQLDGVEKAARPKGERYESNWCDYKAARPIQAEDFSEA